MLFFLLLYRATGIAQPYTFTHYQVESGLSNNTVLCSIQDKHGFMWFGTKDGLNRFDGYSFKTFRNEPGNTASIGNNIIYCLSIDHHGNLWVGTDRGVYRYNDYNESFSFLPEGSQSDIRDIKEDGIGNIWFITGNRLNRYNPETQKNVTYNDPRLVAVSLAIADGVLWVATTNHVIERYNAVTNTFTAFDVFAHSGYATSFWIQKLYYAGNGNLFIGASNQGFKLFNTHNNTYRDVLTHNADKTEIFVRDFIHQSDNLFWIATESGLYVYNLRTNETQLLHKQYNDPYSLSDNAIYTFSKDKEGGVWLGTYFGGLNYYARQYTSFQKFFPKMGENSLSGNAVREICADKNGTLWIGTEDAGLNRFDVVTGQFVNYKASGKPTDISASNIHGLLACDDLLLIGTFEHGLDVMQIATGKVTGHYVVAGNSALRSNFFYTLYKTSKGDIIAATSRGLYYFNLKSGQFRLVPGLPLDMFYTSIFEDHNGILWLGTYRDGLYRLDTKTNKARLYQHNDKDTASLCNNKVNMVFEDSRQTLWVATENGLCRLNKDENKFARYNADSLPSNVVYTLCEDAKQRLWITTSKGLASMNLAGKQLKVYTRANGLLSDQFNYNSVHRDGDGNIYMGCVKGMIKFNPDRFIANNFQPPVYITGLQVSGHDLAIGTHDSPLKRSISFTDTIRLAYDQSSFSIDFAALSYTSPQTTSYAYMLSGLDKDWNFLSTNRKVYFTRLSPGQYVFRLKASDDNNLWSKNEAKLTILILPPYWASNLAYVIYVLLILIVIYLLVYSYHRRTQQKNQRRMESLENEKEREIYHAKISFFTHVAHEIRTPLTLIAGPMEKVMEKAADLPTVKKNLATMQRNTNRLLTLTNQLLDFSKTETHGFSLSFVRTDIVQLIKDRIMQFKEAAQQKKIQIKFEHPEPHFYAYVDAEAMTKILSNLLDNAVKYTATKVIIQLDVKQNDFTILMKNDGNIIPEAMDEKIFESFFRMKEAEKQPGTGIGLPLSRYLAELHKGKLILLPLTDSFNTFALTLPVHQDFEFNL